MPKPGERRLRVSVMLGDPTVPLGGLTVGLEIVDEDDSTTVRRKHGVGVDVDAGIGLRQAQLMRAHFGGEGHDAVSIRARCGCHSRTLLVSRPTCTPVAAIRFNWCNGSALAARSRYQ